MKHHFSAEHGGRVLALGLILATAGCVKTNEPSATSRTHPSPAAGQTVGAGIGAVGGSIAGGAVGVVEGAAAATAFGAARRFYESKPARDLLLRISQASGSKKAELINQFVAGATAATAARGAVGMAGAEEQ